MQERPNVKAAGQKKYRISVFGKPRSYIPDNVLFFKNKNDDQRVKEVKNEKYYKDLTKRTFTTMESKTPSIVPELDSWKKNKMTPITQEFKFLHSLLRELCLQSLTANITTPELIDVLTYYPTIFDYSLVSKSCKTVVVNMGQVPMYRYDEQHDSGEAFKGNMFLALHANAFSSLRKGKPYTAAQFDEWAKNLAYGDSILDNLNTGISGSRDSCSGGPPGDDGSSCPGPGADNDGPTGSGGSIDSYAVEDWTSPCVGSAESGGSNRPSSSETTSTIDATVSDMKKKSNYFGCSHIQESSEDHVNQVFDMTVEGCLFCFSNYESNELKMMNPHDLVVVKCLDRENWYEYAHHQRTVFGDYLEWEDFVSYFNNEVEAYNKIWNYNKDLPFDKQIHVPKFFFAGETTSDDLKRVWFNADDMRLVFGPFMVLERLDPNMRPPETTEELAKVEQELIKLARIGIKHDDIRKSNFLFDEKNDVAFVIDFQYVELAPDGFGFRADVVSKEMRQEFTQLQKESISEK
ncbi:unnamed protein product [Ambrosiozyma monospora]|uniref:Unnamed protein product n=1 Tax=Ambrosiozyma monospora TaxID=43982 RepID=A0A9W7DHI4_AMBMO|nr:unnamed protein product [Ambrosiozyma monospora]